MGILLINSSTNFSSVSIGDNNKMTRSKLSLNHKGHSEILPPMIYELLNEYLQPIEAVAVVIGPSSYTALRLGITAAKMLSIAWNIPIIAIRTSFIYSYIISSVSSKTMHLPHCIILDTKRQKFWIETYSKDNTFYSNPQAKLYNKNDLLHTLSNTKFAISGDCLSTLQENYKIDPIIHEKSLIIEPPCLEKFQKLQYHASLNLWNNKSKHSHILSQEQADRLKPIYFGDVR